MADPEAVPSPEQITEAEAWARGYAAKPEKERHREVGALLAEYDRRGAELDALRSEVADLRRFAADEPNRHERWS